MVSTAPSAGHRKKDNENALNVSRDSFHRGAFEAYQPSGSGHRSGLDALLLAAALPKGASGTVADLGTGVGVAGFAALNLNRELDLLGVDINPQLIELARKSLQLAVNAKFRSRAKFLEADVCLSGQYRERAGLTDNSVNYALMNPPYNGPGQRPPLDSLKLEAHVMGAGGIDGWFRTAAAMTKPGGMLCMIYRTENLGEVLACCQGRFGGLEILPVYSRSDEAAKRLIIRGTRGSRAPMAIVPGIVIHKDDGEFTATASPIFDGKARLAFSG